MLLVVVVGAVCVLQVDVGWCWSGRRGPTCCWPCVPVQSFPRPLVTFLRLFHKPASGVVTKPLPPRTKAGVAESRGWEQVGREVVWGGGAGSHGKPHSPGQVQRLGLVASWGSRNRVEAQAACLFSTTPRFLLGSARVCVQKDLFAVHTCMESCPWESWLQTQGWAWEGGLRVQLRASRVQRIVGENQCPQAPDEERGGSDPTGSSDVASCFPKNCGACPDEEP